MALTADFDCNFGICASQIINWLVGEVGCKILPDDSRWVSMPGVYVIVLDGKSVDKGMQHLKLFKSNYGFTPSESIVFRYDKGSSFEEGVANSIKIIGRMLRKFKGDAVLLQSGELPILLRKGADTVLCDDYTDFWRTYGLPDFCSTARFVHLGRM